MPYPLPPEAEAAFAAGRMCSAHLLDLYCADGVGDPLTFRFWDWSGGVDYPANDILAGTDPVTYVSMHRRMEIGRELRASQTIAAEPMVITFDASRAGDDEDPIGQFTDSVWHQRRARVRQVLLDIETGASPTEPVWEWRGRMDKRSYVRQMGDRSTLVLNCEGGLFRIRGRRMHTRTDADQQRRLVGDLFFAPTPKMIGLPALWAKATANIPGTRVVAGGAIGGGGNNYNSDTFAH